MVVLHREMLLQSFNIGVLGSLFTFGAAPRPSGLGVQTYGSLRTLGLCPATPNCVSTAEEANNVDHYIPPWTYNPPDKRGARNMTQAEAMEELVDVVWSQLGKWDRHVCSLLYWFTVTTLKRQADSGFPGLSGFLLDDAQVQSSRPDNFEPKIVRQTEDYLYAEYASPTFGFTDDVEFFFSGNDRVEYRSASRLGASPATLGHLKE